MRGHHRHLHCAPGLLRDKIYKNLSLSVAGKDKGQSSPLPLACLLVPKFQISEVGGSRWRVGWASLEAPGTRDRHLAQAGPDLSRSMLRKADSLPSSERVRGFLKAHSASRRPQITPGSTNLPCGPMSPQSEDSIPTVTLPCDRTTVQSDTWGCYSARHCARPLTGPHFCNPPEALRGRHHSHDCVPMLQRRNGGTEVRRFSRRRRWSAAGPGAHPAHSDHGIIRPPPPTGGLPAPSGSRGWRL